MINWQCPECSAIFLNKTQFRYHINNFNHAKALKEEARADKWVTIWQAGTFCDVAKMARRYHIDYEYLRKLLIKKGVYNAKVYREYDTTGSSKYRENTGPRGEILPLQSIVNDGHLPPVQLSDVGLSQEGLRPEEPIQNQPGEVSNETTN